MKQLIYRDPTPQEWQKVVDNEALLNKFVARIREGLSAPEFLSFSELKSLGWEGMLRAAQNWDPKRGRFSTLAWFCVNNVISVGIREELAQRGHLPKKGSWGNATCVFSSAEIEDATEPEFEGDVDEYADLYTAIDRLDGFEYDVVVLHYFGTKEHPNGRSTREIGKLLGYSSAWISIVLRRSVAKLREQLAPEGMPA